MQVIGSMQDEVCVCGLLACTNAGILSEQIRKFAPDLAVLCDAKAVSELASLLMPEKGGCRVSGDEEAIMDMIRSDEVTDVIIALPGLAGLPYTIEGIRQGKRILLANKESLVVAGSLVMKTLADSTAELIPVDSEHNALFQILGQESIGKPLSDDVRQIVLTASGGPFRSCSGPELVRVTPEQACAHPIWPMGQKISVDSATLMNKGLEVIEAYWLFNAPVEKINVTIHPQSVIHGIVEFVDGNSVAHMGVPDMRLPIASALAHPRRINNGLAAPDWSSLGSLSFEEPRLSSFPCLDLAYESLRMGGGSPAALNAANEVAVERFLSENVPFTSIPRIVEYVLRTCEWDDRSYKALMETDTNARRLAWEAKA